MGIVCRMGHTVASWQQFRLILMSKKSVLLLMPVRGVQLGFPAGPEPGRAGRSDPDQAGDEPPGLRPFCPPAADCRGGSVVFGNLASNLIKNCLPLLHVSFDFGLKHLLVPRPRFIDPAVDTDRKIPRDVAVIGLARLDKPGTGRVEGRNRGQGSIARIDLIGDRRCPALCRFLGAKLRRFEADGREKHNKAGSDAGTLAGPASPRENGAGSIRHWRSPKGRPRSYGHQVPLRALSPLRCQI